jgi:hypothetical protein
MVDQSEAINIVNTLVAAMINDELREKFRLWGKAAETRISELASQEIPTPEFNKPNSFDSTMMASPVIFQKKGEDGWMIGYQFSIQRVYLTFEEVEIKGYSNWCFLAFGPVDPSIATEAQLGEEVYITDLFTKEEIGSFQATNTTH